MKILRRKYDPDIKDKVSDLLKEALRGKSPTEPKLSKPVPSSSATRTNGGKAWKATIVAVSPHNDIVRDLGEQRPNITFQHLLDDNKTYHKLLTVAMRRPRRQRPIKILEIYHAENEDLEPLEIEMKICGCTISQVPIDSGYEVNIMT